jgi:ADP-ribosylglycohydrolase
LAILTKSAETTTLIATNLGGDTDSVAAIVSAIAGALNPSSVNLGWLKDVEEVNNHQLSLLATQLLENQIPN